MIHPAPTNQIDPTIARGVLESVEPGSGSTPSHVIIEFPNTSYRTHLVPTRPIKGDLGKRILGVIRVDARRVDTVDTGGKYIEPVFGRPRRVQGRVIAHNDSTRTIVVDAGMPIHLHLLDDRQRPHDFAQGDLVSCDVKDGATFTQV
jgi:hypothetical protein